MDKTELSRTIQFAIEDAELVCNQVKFGQALRDAVADLKKYGEPLELNDSLVREVLECVEELERLSKVFRVNSIATANLPIWVERMANAIEGEDNE